VWQRKEQAIEGCGDTAVMAVTEGGQTMARGGGGGRPAAWGGMGTGWGGFQPFQGQGQSTGNEMINNHENDRNNDIHYSNSRNHF
jgi:hypothetical protein